MLKSLTCRRCAIDLKKKNCCLVSCFFTILHGTKISGLLKYCMYILEQSFPEPLFVKSRDLSFLCKRGRYQPLRGSDHVHSRGCDRWVQILCPSNGSRGVSYSIFDAIINREKYDLVLLNNTQDLLFIMFLICLYVILV